MAARLSAFVIWALVAGSLAFWGLRLFVSPAPTPSYAVGVGEASAPRGDLTRLLGAADGPAAAVQPAAASRFALSGVLAPKEGYAGNHGVALIAVDGRPARAYQVGAHLIDNWVLQGVTRRTASLGPSEAAAAVVLELPERPSPATGTLPQVNGGETPGTPAPVAPMQMQAQPPSQYAPPPPQQQQDMSPPPDGGAPGPRLGQGPPRRSAPESR
jgi:general secretion pathway protein C